MSPPRTSPQPYAGFRHRRPLNLKHRPDRVYDTGRRRSMTRIVVIPRTVAKATRKNRSSRASLQCGRYSSRRIRARKSAGEMPLRTDVAGDGVLDDREVVAVEQVDVTLKRERPVLRRPLAHVI